ncbi:MAG: TlpA disulfide reductase family protein [Dehalococcoidales bacterium]|nr:TlpA disulfide reductase family protein [Dehalococcoidales bacterium]
MNRIFKAVILIILTPVLFFAGCTGNESPVDTTPTDLPEVGTKVGNLAPDFELQNLDDGQVVSLSGLRGKPVLINFWATWCPPCNSEMPYLQQIYEEWSDRGLVMLAIDIREESSVVKEFLTARNLSLPVYIDTDASVAQKYGISAIPTTYFVDKDGKIYEKVIGAFPSKESIEVYLTGIIP